MKKYGNWRVLALFAVFALILAACGTDTPAETTAAPGPDTTAGPDDTGGSDTTAGPDTTGAVPDTTVAGGDGIVSTYIGEPEFLRPDQTVESEGAAVLRALFQGLIDYNPETSEPEFTAVAESIESADEGLTWNVTLNDGWTFHDGTPVTAASFVDAWNYAAFGPNAAQSAGFMAPIAGFLEVQCGTVTEPDPETGEDVDVADCEGSPPAAETMTGLTVVDDLHFDIALAAPESFFATRLGYSAYYPLPESFYADPDAYNEAPVGNGPFMMDGSWTHDVEIKTVAYPDYGGDDPAQIAGLTFKIYADVNTAINDLEAGELDIVDSLVPERLAEVQGLVPNFGETASSSINYLGLPSYSEQLADPNIRAALSMAIDRQALVDSPIFEGTRAPAFNILSPVIPGYTDDVCPNWNFDPETAKQLWDEAGGITEPMTVWFNSGAGHDAWVEAVVNFWAQNLGLDPSTVTFEQLDFADYLPKIDAQEMTGPFRLGWGMDYPHPQNYLQLILDSRFTSAEGGANSTFYSNPEYDAKVDEALAITNVEESLPVWQEAAVIACEDTPLIPMFYGLNQYAWNDTVGGVYVNAFGNIEYTDLTATG